MVHRAIHHAQHALAQTLAGSVRPGRLARGYQHPRVRDLGLGGDAAADACGDGDSVLGEVGGEVAGCEEFGAGAGGGGAGVLEGVGLLWEGEEVVGGC